MNIRSYLSQSNQNPRCTERCTLSRSCTLPEGCHIGGRLYGEPLTCCTVPLEKTRHSKSEQIVCNKEVYIVSIELFLAETCTCGCAPAPLSRGQTAHCDVSYQGVAFLAGKVTPRTEREGLQGMYTRNVARKWKQNGDALFYCNRTIDSDHKHVKPTCNCVIWLQHQTYVANVHADIIFVQAHNEVQCFTALYKQTSVKRSNKSGDLNLFCRLVCTGCDWSQ